MLTEVCLSTVHRPRQALGTEARPSVFSGASQPPSSRPAETLCVPWLPGPGCATRSVGGGGGARLEASAAGGKEDNLRAIIYISLEHILLPWPEPIVPGWNRLWLTTLTPGSPRWALGVFSEAVSSGLGLQAIWGCKAAAAAPAITSRRQKAEGRREDVRKEPAHLSATPAPCQAFTLKEPSPHCPRQGCALQ
ncbi:hypothetical protein mRhiFer1_010211 [Rhinolophus ferrumequinum]|uniref:Uncharacterized protein n=1 Tax=Rhinolophus ferrumequinum TaxID=59479 RepID=A0A7J7X587_RHIFE|nr:hypothetical protein mRhiFer1_010211 [Rhinolophus ferrumequinum]